MTSLKQAMRQELDGWAQSKNSGKTAIEQAVDEARDEIAEAIKKGATYETIASWLANHMAAAGEHEIAGRVTRKSVAEAARALGIYARPGRLKAKGKSIVRPAAGSVLAASKPVVKPSAGPASVGSQLLPKPAASPTPAPAQPAFSPVASPTEQQSVSMPAKPDYQAGITPDELPNM